MSDQVYEIDGEEFSIDELMAMSYDDVAEVRAFTFPDGVYRWEILKAEKGPSVITIDDVKRTVPSVIFTLGCKQVIAVPKMPDGIGEEDMPGKELQQRFTLGKDGPQKFFGRVKAFLVDIGFGEKYKGQKLDFDTLLTASVSYMFQAPIRVTSGGKNNPDAKYANLVLTKGKVIPVEA